ncbi:MAG: hypothetical protein JEY79_17375 [Pseudodesulfovibrio sp.]|nr:hypothetical protein [Pseudodesulfovibrio sp.]
MSSYQPFLIASHQTGLDLGIEPWLLPPDAFSSMEDCFIERGVLAKRKGFSLFATCPSAGSIVGVFNRVKAEDGGKVLLAADVDYLFQYSGTAFAKVEHDELGTAAVWTGDEDDLLHTANWKGTVYMTNGKQVSGETTAGDGTGNDGIQRYSGSAFNALRPDLSGDGEYCNGCKLMVVHKERLILFGVYENGSFWGNRARWCVAGNPNDWTNDGYLDATTSEHIKGVAILRDDIIVFFDNSIWLLRYTGDADLPFRFEQVSKRGGCIASFTAAAYDEIGFALDKAGIITCDGLQTKILDDKMPDITGKMNISAVGRAYSRVVEQEEQVWIAYPGTGDDDNSQVMVYNYREGTWSIFNLAFRCFGDSATTTNVKWSDLDVGWLTYAVPWVSGTVQSGYPTILAGGDSGAIYRVNHLDADAGADIGFELVSGRWNPFKEQGLKVRLNRVDFLVESGDYEASVDFFRDFETTSYQTKTLDFNGDGEKVWVRVYTNCTANFHRLKIRQTASDEPIKIHAIMPWFKAEGGMD